MGRWSKAALSMLLWTWGGTVYFLGEVAFKSAVGNGERISWTMLVLAIMLCIPLERFGAELPWETPLPLQAVICAAAITVTELAAGLVLNVWLGLGVWDYSDLSLNLWGQISLHFSMLWAVVAMAGIVVFDWLRYAVEGGERPRYRWT